MMKSWLKAKSYDSHTLQIKRKFGATGDEGLQIRGELASFYLVQEIMRMTARLWYTAFLMIPQRVFAEEDYE